MSFAQTPGSRPLDGLRRRLPRAARAAVSGVASIVFPRACLACGAHLGDAPLPLCDACLADIDPVRPDALQAHLDAAAAASPGPPGVRLAPAHATWRYRSDGPLADVLHALKYGHRPALARRLGAVLGAAAPPPDGALLVPMPLTRVRWLERGYNQAEEIALGLASATGHAVRSDLLARAAFARSQTRLDRARRRANVAHAFAASADAAGRALVLVDDVVTTGATAAAAAQALREAGAASVGLWCLAWTE